MIRSEIPKPDSLVHGAREESVVGRIHGEGDHLLVVTTKVPDVLVLLEGHVPEQINLLYCFCRNK